MIHHTLAPLAAALIDKIKAAPTPVKHAWLDEASQPLFDEMVRLGVMVDGCAIVEAQGAFDHDLVAVCQYQGDAERWYNVYRDGKVEEM